MSDILIKDLNYIYKNNNSNSFFKDKIILITGASGFFLDLIFQYYFSYFVHNLEMKKIIIVDININKIKKKFIKKYQKISVSF